MMSEGLTVSGDSEVSLDSVELTRIVGPLSSGS